ncbi:hypothetical protein IIE18_11940 [Pseudomonas sp. V1]|uniref:hypothetical protein n=1 Tax=Pseudomonas arcuscaelestis TaxID=2710591 RepID=UPI00193F35CF|nr:hypothetical protein [Pseudomonas arcuscaelestis]MBM3105850.1 hypothetical protein [Pseudomonas arcuscaelestis]
MKLLAVEDEGKTAAHLQHRFSEAGFNVDRILSGTNALQHALCEAYDLLIFDVMIRHMGSWAVLRRVRAASMDVTMHSLPGRDWVKGAI